MLKRFLITKARKCFVLPCGYELQLTTLVKMNPRCGRTGPLQMYHLKMWSSSVPLQLIRHLAPQPRWRPVHTMSKDTYLAYIWLTVKKQSSISPVFGDNRGEVESHTVKRTPFILIDICQYQVNNTSRWKNTQYIIWVFFDTHRLSSNSCVGAF